MCTQKLRLGPKMKDSQRDGRRKAKMIEDFTGFQSCVDHFLGLLALFVRIILTHELSGYRYTKVVIYQ